ncbi:MAG: hypothetical protein ACREMJ_04035, partial [Gemmatimonadales bacterium]
ALGVFSASAGSLAALGGLLVVLAGALWRRGIRRRWWHVAVAALLVLAAPYVLRYFGRGIAPPAAGAGLVLWLSWQVALALTSMGLVLLAAALVRGEHEPARVPWPVPAACAWAVVAAVAGLAVWSPAGAWPEWYTFVWLPALAGVLAPAPRGWTLAGTATVAATAAALLTWGAGIEGRIALAQRDALRIGREGDVVALALLEKLGVLAREAPPPRTPSELYALWLRSPLAEQGYPTALALWSDRGALTAELRLADLDLPVALFAALVRSTDLTAGLRVERVERTPGVHYVLVAPLPTGEVLVVGVGPRSRLVPPDRVARFLRGEVGREPPYTISAPFPGEEPGPETRALTWSRDGWTARGERRVAFHDGVRRVHVRVELGGFWDLLVRGVLVVVLDVALLAALWLLGRSVSEGWRPRPPSLLALLRTSYRARLVAALAGFFVLPVLAFAVWSFARLADEARRAGDLLISQTLKDAEATVGAVTPDRPAGRRSGVADLGVRLDAELWLYREGVLAAANAPVLAELGLVDRLLAPAVYRRLALEDELELTTGARTAGRPVRVGYRVVRAGPPGRAILAAPQLL